VADFRPFGTAYRWRATYARRAGSFSAATTALAGRHGAPFLGREFQPAAEPLKFFPANLQRLSAPQITQHERAVGGADQAADLQAEIFEHAADFAVLAFCQ